MSARTREMLGIFAFTAVVVTIILIAAALGVDR